MPPAKSGVSSDSRDRREVLKHFHAITLAGLMVAGSLVPAAALDIGSSGNRVGDFRDHIGR
jgi:hypothetical protein